MFSRSVIRQYSKTQIYSLRAINKLDHMKTAKSLKQAFVQNPESTFLFVEYLKELNKAGQKDLVKIEYDKFHQKIARTNINDYLKVQTQYEIAEKGRYKKHTFPLFSTIFFFYMGWYLISNMTKLMAVFNASDDDDEESDENEENPEAKEDKKKNTKTKWSFKININIGKKKNNEETEDQDNEEDSNDSILEITTGNDDDEGKGNKRKEDDPEKDSSQSKNNKTWLFQDVIQGQPVPQKNVNIKFDDVLGIDEFKHEFEEIVDFLKNPEKYENAGARIPKGILLVGSPGCGKTLMAKALAGESKCSFFYKSGAEFEEVYVGVGARRMRDLFSAAKKHAPSIIFIDEIDSIAGRRGASSMSESRQCINQLLAEMDGFRKNDSVIVVAATNLEQSLDPAVKRSGRFDKIVRVPLPDITGREQILNHFSNKIQIKGVDLSIQARRTIGFSGADLKNFLNTAILHGVRMDRDHANKEDFDFAYDRIKMGIRRAGLLADEGEKRATAIHEIGHAMICALTEGSMPLYKVTIMPSGQSLGHTAMVPEKDMLTQTRKNIEASIDVALGGRAAEELFLGEDYITTGCSSDLQNATNMAYAYVRDLGLKEKEVFINEKSENLSEEYKLKVDNQVQSLLKDSLERTKTKLKAKENEIMQLVEALIEKETLSAEEFKSFL